MIDQPRPCSHLLRLCGFPGIPRIAGAFVAIPIFLIALLRRADNLPALPVCWFHAWTGLPCPGCGLTRAFCAIAHGDVEAAWALNPFAFGFFAFLLLLLIESVVPEPAARYLERAAASRALRWTPPLFLVALLLWGGARLWTAWEVS